MKLPLTNIIETSAVEFSYSAADRTAGAAKVIDGVSVSIESGHFVSVIGRNGSGKTSFARLLNGLLLPTGGIVRVHGIDTLSKERIRDVRRLVGMVFHDPDSQIVGTTVEEDVAFGPENLGLPPDEIRKRVREALQAVAMENRAHSATHLLSGGEKQKVSLAGILAMQPDCIILDEAASMLDPACKNEVMGLIRALNRDKGISVVHITHDMEEVWYADRIIVLDAGMVVLDGTPEEVLSDRSGLRAAGLELPQLAELLYLLKQEGFDLPKGFLNTEEAVAELANCMNYSREHHVHQD